VNVVQLWDLDGERLWMKTMDGPVRDVEIDDEGYYTAAGTEGGQIRLYDRRGEMRWEFETEGSLKSLSLSGSGTTLAVGSGNTLTVFNTAEVPRTPATPTPITTSPTPPPTTEAGFEAVIPGIVALGALAVWRRIGKD
jgi:WD40 repeat protein